MFHERVVERIHVVKSIVTRSKGSKSAFIYRLLIHDCLLIDDLIQLYSVALLVYLCHPYTVMSGRAIR